MLIFIQKVLNFFELWNQSWLHDGILRDPMFKIAGLDKKSWKSRGLGWGFENPEKILSAKSQNPGDEDRDFSFLAISKNPRNPKIPGIGIGIWKSRKDPECQIPKSRTLGSGLKSRGSGFENNEIIPRKSWKIPSGKSQKSRYPGNRNLFFRDIWKKN